MKKIIYIAILAITAAMVCSCSDDNEPNPTNKTDLTISSPQILDEPYLVEESEEGVNQSPIVPDDLLHLEIMLQNRKTTVTLGYVNIPEKAENIHIKAYRKNRDLYIYYIADLTKEATFDELYCSRVSFDIKGLNAGDYNLHLYGTKIAFNLDGQQTETETLLMEDLIFLKEGICFAFTRHLPK